MNPQIRYLPEHTTAGTRRWPSTRAASKYGLANCRAVLRVRRAAMGLIDARASRLTQAELAKALRRRRGQFRGWPPHRARRNNFDYSGVPNVWQSLPAD